LALLTGNRRCATVTIRRRVAFRGPRLLRRLAVGGRPCLRRRYCAALRTGSSFGPVAALALARPPIPWALRALTPPAMEAFGVARSYLARNTYGDPLPVASRR